MLCFFVPDSCHNAGVVGQLSRSPTKLATIMESLQQPAASIIVDGVNSVVTPTLVSLNHSVVTTVDLPALSTHISCVIQHTSGLPKVQVLEDYILVVQATVNNITRACELELSLVLSSLPPCPLCCCVRSSVVTLGHATLLLLPSELRPVLTTTLEELNSTASALPARLSEALVRCQGAVMYTSWCCILYQLLLTPRGPSSVLCAGLLRQPQRVCLCSGDVPEPSGCASHVGHRRGKRPAKPKRWHQCCYR
jgi:hypothetical protein